MSASPSAPPATRTVLIVEDNPTATGGGNAGPSPEEQGTVNPPADITAKLVRSWLDVSRNFRLFTNAECGVRSAPKALPRVHSRGDTANQRKPCHLPGQSLMAA
jgi:hypothetical protein